VSESFELWELEDMCKVWYHTNPSGLVERERFNSFATDFLKLPPGAEEHIDRMFGLIDENKDGVLSFAELSLALATLARSAHLPKSRDLETLQSSRFYRDPVILLWPMYTLHTLVYTITVNTTGHCNPSLAYTRLKPPQILAKVKIPDLTS